MKIQFLKLTNNFNTAVYKKPKDQFQNCNFDTALNMQPLKKDSVEISFEAKQKNKLSSSRFDIKAIENLRCPICSQLMLNNKQINTFVEAVSSKKGQELIDALEQYGKESAYTGKEKDQKSIYRPVEQEAVNILKELAGKYPNKDLCELFQIQRKESLDNLIPLQISIVKKYKNHALNLANEEEREQIRQLVNRYTRQIYGTSDIRFARKSLIKDAVKIFDGQKEKQQNVREILEKLPTSTNNADAFFVKYSSGVENPQQAARILVSRNNQTTEHIHPKSKSGKNHASNYIADCQYCNMKRGNTDFATWINSIPNAQDNLQDYVNNVQAAIDSGFLEKSVYFDYVPNVIKTIREYSGSVINLVQPKSENINSAVLRQRKQTISNFQEEIKKQETEKAALEKEISEIEESNQYKNSPQYKKDKQNLLYKKRAEIRAIRENPQAIKDGLPVLSEEQEKRISTLRYQIKQLRSKSQGQNKKAKKRGEILSLDEVQSQIETLKRQRQLKTEIERELSDKLDIVARKNGITSQCENISKQIAALEKQCLGFKVQLEEEGFDIADKTQYLKYLNVIALIDDAKNGVEEENQRKKPRNLRLQNLQRAYVFNQQEKERLEEITSVKYFIKEKELKNAKEKFNQIRRILANIEQAEQKIPQLQNQQIELIRATGKNNEDYKKKLQNLKKQEEMLLGIEKLDSLRQKYKELSDTISRNRKLLEQLIALKEAKTYEFEALAKSIPSI